MIDTRLTVKMEHPYIAIDDMYKKLMNNTYGVHAARHYHEIKNVIFNNPATIVFWDDGLKTVVKTLPGEAFDPEKGLAMAICKRVCGNKGNYYNEFKKWLPK